VKRFHVFDLSKHPEPSGDGLCQGLEGRQGIVRQLLNLVDEIGVFDQSGKGCSVGRQIVDEAQGQAVNFF